MHNSPPDASMPVQHLTSAGPSHMNSVLIKKFAQKVSVQALQLILILL